VADALQGCQESLRRRLFGEDADTARRERWLETEGYHLLEMTSKADLVFHYGKTQCLGKPVDLVELNQNYVEVSALFH
jgi:hypothetical protein